MPYFVPDVLLRYCLLYSIQESVQNKDHYLRTIEVDLLHDSTICTHSFACKTHLP